uniref:Cysteine rich secreted protein n=1 Tax=Riptortus pedestris TaxID=329032 RepID=R4WNR0_RIPPE|nr:cysteine rich secreted protein [Riptortus pedestris]
MKGLRLITILFLLHLLTSRSAANGEGGECNANNPCPAGYICCLSSLTCCPEGSYCCWWWNNIRCCKIS